MSGHAAAVPKRAVSHGEGSNEQTSSKAAKNSPEVLTTSSRSGGLQRFASREHKRSQSQAVSAPGSPEVSEIYAYAQSYHA